MIRAARPDDDARLVELDRLTWSPEASPLGAPGAGPFFSGGLSPENVLVAEAPDGSVAGYVALGAATRLPSNAHVLSVHGLAVTPELQGRGIGRSLLAAAAEEARRRGARRLTLRVFAVNEPARRLYEACGFVVEGVLREEFLAGGRYVDDVLMALRL